MDTVYIKIKRLELLKVYQLLFVLLLQANFLSEMRRQSCSFDSKDSLE